MPRIGANMETGLILGLGLFVVAGVVLVIIGVVLPRRASAIDDRLAEFGAVGGPQTLEDIELSLPFSERVLSPVIGRVSRFITSRTPAKTLEATQLKLDLAGRPNNWGPREFMGFRFLAALLLGLLGVALFVLLRNVSVPRRLLLVAVAAMLGYFMPTLWLGQKIRRRKNSIIKSLPDALDLLTICVEAGLGFDAAMANVAEKWTDDLSQAFNRVLQEIQLGKLRREALRNMATTMDVPDVSNFVAAIVQAEQLGVSIARVLRIQSDQMRVRRRQRAEELARSAAIKMLPAIAFLIFPAIFVILLGPAVITVMTMDINVFGF